MFKDASFLESLHNPWSVRKIMYGQFNGFFFEIVERRGGYAGYGAKNAPIRLAAQNEYQQSRDNVA